MKQACVIGWPVSHSLSPVIHGYWLRENAIDGAYVTAAVEPKDFTQFIESLSARGFAGANVTVPHKIEACRLCEIRDPSAEAIGAVNTLWFEGGKLCGSNTDALGFTANLDSEAPGWDRGAAAIIGAGGAARAIVWALHQRGFSDIRIVNRTKARAMELSIGVPGASAFALSEIDDALHGANVVVNASTLGMPGFPPLEADLSSLASDATICDIVYHPLETPLLRQARLKNYRAVDGLGMLLHQAVPGFEKWFGVRPEVTPALRRTVLDAVLARESRTE